MEFKFFETRLTPDSVELAKGSDAVALVALVAPAGLVVPAASVAEVNFLLRSRISYRQKHILIKMVC